MTYCTHLFQPETVKVKSIFFFFKSFFMKSKITNFLSLQKSKFNGQLINASGVFTGTALTFWLKYSYKYRKTLMRFMICCHQLHVSWCTAAITQMHTFKLAICTRGLRWKLYLPFPRFIINAGWVILILMTVLRIGMNRTQGGDGGSMWAHVGWHLRMSPVLSSLFPVLLHRCQRTTLNQYNTDTHTYCLNNTNGLVLQL